MNRTIHTAAARQRAIGRVRNGVHRNLGDIAFYEANSASRITATHTRYIIQVMNRRQLLAAGAAFVTTSRLWGKAGIDKSRISAITDEIGLSTLEAIAFAHFYGLQNIEIRNPADRG